MTTGNRQSVEEAASNGLATYLQSTAERERSELAHQLHDNLGGLMVAALMDVAWTQTKLSGIAAEATEKLQRAKEYLSAAIDLSRKLTEDLRPTLLDNVGLFAALRWQMKHLCADANVQYCDHYPINEPRFPPLVSIGLFRFAQEALHLMTGRGLATFVALDIAIDDSVIIVEIAYEGAAGAMASRDGPELASMRNRIHSLDGALALITCSGNPWSVRASVPFIAASST